MALHGQCSECGTITWLNVDGSCTAGHPRESVNGIVDAEDTAATSARTGAAKKVGRLLSDLKKPKTPEEIEARAARDEYEQRVAAAQKALADQAMPLDQSVTAARTSLAAAQAIGTRRVGTFAGLTLTEAWLQTPNGNINLETDQVRATVDAAGNVFAAQKGGIGRAMVGGALAGRTGAIVGSTSRKSKVHDMRELYINVESPSVCAVVKCDPDKGEQARQFVASVHNTAAGAPGHAQQRVEFVPQWVRHVDDLIIQRAGALTAPRQALSDAQAATARVDAAQAALTTKP
jgi:hypothetical protein